VRKEKPKSVPVDPNRPENPVELLVHAANYLAKEVSALADLAGDGAECRTAAGQDVLMAELARRLATYRERGLQALVHVVNDVVAQHNAQVARIEELSPKPEEQKPEEQKPEGQTEKDNGNS